MMNPITDCTNPDERLLQELLDIWESAVKATHHFLNDRDILSLKPYVRQGIQEIPQLYCSFAADTPLGFIGVDNLKIEMLFIDAQARGQGIGRQLIEFAVKELKATEVDVNEQNEQGVGFYTHLGFKAYGRSPLDSQGNPFPIVHMRL